MHTHIYIYISSYIGFVKCGISKGAIFLRKMISVESGYGISVNVAEPIIRWTGFQLWRFMALGLPHYIYNLFAMVET